MKPILRTYQAQLKADIYKAWDELPSTPHYDADGYAHLQQNVLAQCPTRAGKTVVFSDIMDEHDGTSIAIAHRQELIGQISLTLAKFGIRHRAIAPDKVIRFLVQQHMQHLGESFYDPTARRIVAGVDTLVSPGRQDVMEKLGEQVSLVIQDEAHHVLESNKWGRSTLLFPNAKGLYVTANTIRADGKGLSRETDGLMDALVTSIGLFDLIAMGYATPYRVIAPQAKDLDLDHVDISSATGDYNKNQLIAATRKSSVIGDVVEHYIKFAPGELGITFAPDVETAGVIAQQFNAAGVKAEVISAKTPDAQRMSIQEDFKRGDIKQMVNVDLFGEGYDVPKVKVVSMARATASFNLFCQQFARGLTVMEGKDEAIILDHVGNCIRFSNTHGMPDSDIVWSLNRREKRPRGQRNPDLIPQKACLNPECMAIYEAKYKCCPHCGHYSEPSSRTSPKFVDGDLEELTPETLQKMRDQIKTIDTPVNIMQDKWKLAGLNYPMIVSNTEKHKAKQKAQIKLRNAIAWWGAFQRQKEKSDSVNYRIFYLKYGIDVLTAQSLGRADAEALTDRINKELGR